MEKRLSSQIIDVVNSEKGNEFLSIVKKSADMGDLPALSSNLGLNEGELSTGSDGRVYLSPEYDSDSHEFFESITGAKELDSKALQSQERSNTQGIQVKFSDDANFEHRTGIPAAMAPFYAGLSGAGEAFAGAIDATRFVPNAIANYGGKAIEHLGQEANIPILETVGDKLRDTEFYVSDVVSWDAYDINNQNHDISNMIGAVGGQVALAMVGGTVVSNSTRQMAVGLGTKKMINALGTGALTAPFMQGRATAQATKELFHTDESVKGKAWIEGTIKTAISTAAFTMLGSTGELIMPNKLGASVYDVGTGFWADSILDYIQTGESHFNPFDAEDWTKEKFFGAALGAGFTFAQNGRQYKIDRELMRSSLGLSFNRAFNLSAKGKMGNIRIGSDADIEATAFVEKSKRSSELTDELIRKNKEGVIDVTPDNADDVIGLILNENGLKRSDLAEYSAKMDASDKYYKMRYDSAKDLESKFKTLAESNAKYAENKGKESARVRNSVEDEIEKGVKENQEALKEKIKASKEKINIAKKSDTSTEKKKSAKDIIKEKLNAKKKESSDAGLPFDNSHKAKNKPTDTPESRETADSAIKDRARKKIVSDKDIFDEGTKSFKGLNLSTGADNPLHKIGSNKKFKSKDGKSFEHYDRDGFKVSKKIKSDDFSFKRENIDIIRGVDDGGKGNAFAYIKPKGKFGSDSIFKVKRNKEGELSFNEVKTVQTKIQLNQEFNKLRSKQKTNKPIKERDVDLEKLEKIYGKEFGNEVSEYVNTLRDQSVRDVVGSTKEHFDTIRAEKKIDDPGYDQHAESLESMGENPRHSTDDETSRTDTDSQNLNINDADADYVAVKSKSDFFETKKGYNDWKEHLPEKDFGNMISDMKNGLFSIDRLYSEKGYHNTKENSDAGSTISASKQRQADAISWLESTGQQMRYTSEADYIKGLDDVVSIHSSDIIDVIRESVNPIATDGKFETDFDSSVKSALGDGHKAVDFSDEYYSELFSIGGSTKDILDSFFKSDEFLSSIEGGFDRVKVMSALSNKVSNLYGDGFGGTQPITYKNALNTYKESKIKNYISSIIGDKAYDNLISRMERGENVSDVVIIDHELRSYFKKNKVSRKLLDGYGTMAKSLNIQLPMIILKTDVPKISAAYNSNYIKMNPKNLNNGGIDSSYALSHELGHKLFEEGIPTEVKGILGSRYLASNKIIEDISKASEHGDLEAILGKYAEAYKNNIHRTPDDIKKTLSDISKVNDEIESIENTIREMKEETAQRIDSDTDLTMDKQIIFDDNLAKRELELEKLQSTKNDLKSNINGISEGTFLAEVSAEMMALKMVQDVPLSTTQKVIKIAKDIYTNLTRAFDGASSTEDSAQFRNFNDSRAMVFKNNETFFGDMYKTMNKIVDAGDLIKGDGVSSSSIYNAMLRTPEAAEFYKTNNIRPMKKINMDDYDVFGLPKGPDELDDGIEFNNKRFVESRFSAIGRLGALPQYNKIIKDLYLDKDIEPYQHHGLFALVTNADFMTKTQKADFAEYYNGHKEYLDNARSEALINRGVDIKNSTTKADARLREAEEFSRIVNDIEETGSSKFDTFFQSAGFTGSNTKTYMLALLKDIGKNFGYDSKAYTTADANIEAIKRGQASSSYSERYLTNIDNTIKKIPLSGEELSYFGDWMRGEQEVNTETNKHFNALKDELLELEIAANNHVESIHGERPDMVLFEDLDSYVIDVAAKISKPNMEAVKRKFKDQILDLASTEEGAAYLKDKNIILKKKAGATDIPETNLFKVDGQEYFLSGDMNKFFREYGKIPKNDLKGKVNRVLNDVFYNSVLTLNGSFFPRNLLKDYRSSSRKTEAKEGLISKNFLKYGKSYFKNIRQAFRDLKGKDVSEQYTYLTDNGLISAVGSSYGILDNSEVLSRLSKRRETIEPTKANLPKRTLKSIYRNLEDAITATERAGKYTEYEFLRDMSADGKIDLTPDRANNIRNLGNPNPNDRGSASGTLGNVFAFYNSIVRGYAEEANLIARTVRSKGSKRAAAMDIATRNLAVAMPAIAYALMENGLFGDDAQEIARNSNKKRFATGSGIPVAGMYDKQGRIVGSVESSMFLLDEQQQMASTALLFAVSHANEVWMDNFSESSDIKDYKYNPVSAGDYMDYLSIAIPDLHPTINLIKSVGLGMVGAPVKDNFGRRLNGEKNTTSETAKNILSYNLDNFGMGVFYNSKDLKELNEAEIDAGSDILSSGLDFITMDGRNFTSPVDRFSSVISKRRLKPRAESGYFKKNIKDNESLREQIKTNIYNKGR